MWYLILSISDLYFLSHLYHKPADLDLHYIQKRVLDFDRNFHSDLALIWFVQMYMLSELLGLNKLNQCSILFNLFYNQYFGKQWRPR